jgi:putative membrane protein (TIGR04086 family)
MISMAVAVITGLCCTLAAAALFSCLIFFVLKDIGLAGVLAAASLAVGAYIGAYIQGKYRRHKGLISGIICGIIMYAVILGFGSYFTGEFAGIKKLLLLALFGAAGGVAGVNSKRPASLYQ